MKEKRKKHLSEVNVQKSFGTNMDYQGCYLGPILIGTHIAAFIGMTLGASKVKTLVWSTISIGAWAIVFGVATSLGFDFFVRD